MPYIPFDELSKHDKDIVVKEFEKYDRFDYGIYKHLVSETGCFIDFKPLKEHKMVSICGNTKIPLRKPRNKSESKLKAAKEVKQEQPKRKRGRPKKNERN